MHQCNISGQRLTEDQSERRPEQQRTAQRRAGSQARLRRPVKAG
jgi:hypothetical protein